MDIPFNDFDINEYINYTKKLKEIKDIKSLNKLGYQNIKYSFSNNNKNKLNAVIPTINDFNELNEIIDNEIDKQYNNTINKINNNKRNKNAIKPFKVSYTLHTITSNSPSNKPIVKALPLSILNNANYLSPKSINHYVNQFNKNDNQKSSKTFNGLAGDYYIIENGIKYGFDYNGFKVPYDDINISKDEINKKKNQINTATIISNDNTNKDIVFTGRIIDLTNRYVKEKIENIEEEKLDKTWKPNKLPYTTYQLTNTSKVLPYNAIREIPNYILNYVKKHSLNAVNRIIITIEYCSNCYEHEEITHHDENRYINVAKSVKSELNKLFLLYDIYFTIQLIPSNLYTRMNNLTTYQSKQIICNIDTSSRIGAMEIQIDIRYNNQHINHILHSKLFRGTWPNLSMCTIICQRIIDQLDIPLVKIKRRNSFVVKLRKNSLSNRRSSLSSGSDKKHNHKYIDKQSLQLPNHLKNHKIFNRNDELISIEGDNRLKDSNKNKLNVISENSIANPPKDGVSISKSNGIVIDDNTNKIDYNKSFGEVVSIIDLNIINKNIDENTLSNINDNDSNSKQESIQVNVIDIIEFNNYNHVNDYTNIEKDIYNLQGNNYNLNTDEREDNDTEIRKNEDIELDIQEEQYKYNKEEENDEYKGEEYDKDKEVYKNDKIEDIEEYKDDEYDKDKEVYKHDKEVIEDYKDEEYEEDKEEDNEENNKEYEAGKVDDNELPYDEDREEDNENEDEYDNDREENTVEEYEKDKDDDDEDEYDEDFDN